MCTVFINTSVTNTPPFRSAYQSKRQSQTHSHTQTNTNSPHASTLIFKRVARLTQASLPSRPTASVRSNARGTRRIRLCKYTVRNVQLTFYESLERTHETLKQTERSSTHIERKAKPFRLSLIPCKGLLEEANEK